jgi:hypothetical protein
MLRGDIMTDLAQLEARLDELEARAAGVLAPHDCAPPRLSAGAVPLDSNTLLRRRETAAALTAAGFRVAATSLERWASTGTGPPYQKFGGIVVYRWGDTLAWAKARSTAPHTSAAEHRNRRRQPSADGGW